jgi:tRNA(Ile)-lysidine synthase
MPTELRIEAALRLIPHRDVDAAVERSARRATAARAKAIGAARDEWVSPRIVLAVSGGRDSMVLLDAFVRCAPHAIAAVATFDHCTGDHATAATELVADACAMTGLRVYTAKARGTLRSEAALREARWQFLREVAAAQDGVIATAHTRDDNVETILMRELRGAGARGLAALYAPSTVLRPFLSVSRCSVARYAAAHGVRWIEDPSNESRAYLRNRVRHDILPAMRAVRPSLDAELLDVARRAAVIRRAFDRVAKRLALEGGDGSLSVAAAPLADYDAEALRALWPAIAARAGIVLDARGTAGLARFTTRSAPGARMQLSGGIDVLRRHDAIVLRTARAEVAGAAPLAEVLQWGHWRFTLQRGAPIGRASGTAWSAVLPAAGRLLVREWLPGDRMHGAGDAAPRRVKRFLRDAGLVGPERIGWPVVVSGEEVVWIPGVRRSDAATARSGRPEAVYVCERTES